MKVPQVASYVSNLLLLSMPGVEWR